jgi:hypothetical protein
MTLLVFGLLFVMLGFAAATESQQCPRCRRAYHGMTCSACGYVLHRASTKEIHHAHRER